MQFSELSQIPESEIARLLSQTRQQSRFSAAKKGLEHLKAFDKSLNLPDTKTLSEIAKHKKNRAVKPPKVIDSSQIRRKVNAIRDDKLKSAYRLMEKSGLRVSECAALEKRDFRLDNGVLKLDVRKAKGGSVDVVHTIEDKWLSAKLQELLSPLNADDKPFYSAQTMKNRAAKYGIECHDFRRIAANEFRDSLLDEGATRSDANAETQGFMRHSRFSTTRRYLSGRRLTFVKQERTRRADSLRP
jgi:integrase